jgi:hypothetical protein
MAGNPKGNPQNLTPLNKRTKKEQRKVQSQGGKASAKKRRERKEFKEDLKTALTVVMENDKTVQEIGIEALLDKFMKGDLKAFEIVRDSVGEKPTDKQEVKVVESDWFK